MVFDAVETDKWLNRLARIPGSLRTKAVIRTNEGWWKFNFVSQAETLKPSGYRRDSRIEVIMEGPCDELVDRLNKNSKPVWSTNLSHPNLERIMIVILALFACMDDGKVPVIDDTPQSPFDHLKIEEVYYAGSIPTEGIDRYYSDQFIQLRNNSEYTLDIGGLGIGDVFGLAGEINSGYEPDGFADDPDNVYLGNLWQIPMDSQYRYLEPDGCIKIAHDAADLSPFSPFSHFDAHFETYVEEYDRDTDDPIVKT